jgi:hypothetical protein
MFSYPNFTELPDRFMPLSLYKTLINPVQSFKLCVKRWKVDGDKKAGRHRFDGSMQGQM